MKQYLLLTLVSSTLLFNASAQKNSARNTAYAITAIEKTGTDWTEVKLIDLNTGAVIESVYQSASEKEPLNARSLKPITFVDNTVPRKKIMNLPEKDPITGQLKDKMVTVYYTSAINTSKPFATGSAACAYDKIHNRFYYTPMNIHELRYIDLNSGKLYYFEDELFGNANGSYDQGKQITRMAIAADGNGYALTNDGTQFIQFNTDQNAVINNLGTIADDASNGNTSIHSKTNFGGDMVADDAGNLYVITASSNVFFLDIKTRTARFIGSIKGLPTGFSSNAAAVEKARNIIISTATSSTNGYYRVNIDELSATKISNSPTVFSSSDFANANLLTTNKNDRQLISQQETANDINPKISVYPNPVTNGLVNISFNNYEPGSYLLQLIDLDGKLLQSISLQVSGKSQSKNFKLPVNLAKGSYLLKLLNSKKVLLTTEKIIVE